MVMYHGTTEANWHAIKQEGVLHGRKNVFWCGKPVSRVTYLSPCKEVAKRYGPVILEIDVAGVDECAGLEYVTYEPIPLANVKLCETMLAGKGE